MAKPFGSKHKRVKNNIINNQNIKIMEEKNVIGVKPHETEPEVTTTEVYQDIFILVTRKGKTQIAIRNSIIVRDEFDTVEAAKNYIDAKPWKLIVNTVLFIAEDVKNNKQ